MNGRRARAIRKAVYPDGKGRTRSYFVSNRRERQVEVPERPLQIDEQGRIKTTMTTVVTYTVVADHRRRMCQYMKRHWRNGPVNAL